MNAEELREKLRLAQEPKGCFFNPDHEQTMELLEALLVNRQRYGYMSCPCRLASGDREKDADIVCPCVYRKPDMEEFGCCYCALYVSPAWKEGAIPHALVPERRPVEKMFA